MMAIVSLSEEARADIARLAVGLRNYVSEEAADNFPNIIREACDSLAESPLANSFSTLGREFHETTVKANKRRQYRFLYRYDVSRNEVEILAVKDAREESFTGYPPIWTINDK